MPSLRHPQSYKSATLSSCKTKALLAVGVSFSTSSNTARYSAIFCMELSVIFQTSTTRNRFGIIGWILKSRLWRHVVQVRVILKSGYTRWGLRT